jgi:hypothetical protein
MVSWKTPIENFYISLPKKNNSVPRYGLIFILSIMHAINTFLKNGSSKNCIPFLVSK